MDNKNKPKKIMCKLCGHIWYSVLGRLPVSCPHCKRHDYHKKRRENGKRTN
jgi:hypothetical protein